VSLIRIPKDLEGWEFRPGNKLVAGYAHASLAVEPVIETRGVVHAADDDNPNRLTSLRVLGDLCWGSDPQWLYAPVEENRFYSHDHGHYFPGGPSWTIDTLRGADPNAEAPMGMLPFARPDVALKVAERLETAGAVAIASVCSGLPTTWPVTDDELVELVTFLDKRRAGVVQRVRNTCVPKEGGT
jgi:hypothetical protein